MASQTVKAKPASKSDPAQPDVVDLVEIDCYPTAPVTAVHPEATSRLLEDQAIFLLSSAAANLEFISTHSRHLDELTPQGVCDLICGPLNLVLNAKSMVQAASEMRTRDANSESSGVPAQH